MASNTNNGGSRPGEASSPANGSGSPGVRYGEPLSAGVLESPAAERNKQPILEVLRRVLPRRGAVLEIASGTGQHVVHFARALPPLSWQPTDADETLLDTIRQRLRTEPLDNVHPPLHLDVQETPWPALAADAVLCINMIHIAPWAAAEGLLLGSSRLLSSGSPLILYGPYKLEGRHTAPSNAAFDASLRARDPEWGVRDLDEVTEAAKRYGFAFEESVALPANNLVVVLRKR
jgi:hypothetical protein